MGHQSGAVTKIFGLKCFQHALAIGNLGQFVEFFVLQLPLYKAAVLEVTQLHLVL